MGRVGIVCDSTCDLGPDWLREHDVTMVPLKVLFGQESFLDWVDFTPTQFFDKLAAAKTLPKTSQPSPADFSAVYARLADEGCESIVSIHLTSALSGTFESAILAAASSPVRVHVVDTKHVCHAVALVLRAAIEARDTGKTAEQIASIAMETAAATRMYFILDTLEYLVKGGRAGAAAGLAASVLNIKPILTFNTGGTIEPFRKVKGMRKAMTELATQVAQDSAARPVRTVVFGSESPDLVAEQIAALQTGGANLQLEEGDWRIGSVIGTYAGPRAVGIAYHPVA